MTWLDITREEYDRWPEETQVLVDLPFKLEVYAPDDCAAALHMKLSHLAPYRLRHEYMYRQWFSSWDLREESADSLDGVETFDMRQAWLPVAEMPIVSVRQLALDAHRMIGIEATIGSQRITEAYALTELPGGAPMTALQVAAYLLSWMMDPRADQFRAEAARERVPNVVREQLHQLDGRRRRR